jgi:hypothetical protein
VLLSTPTFIVRSSCKKMTAGGGQNTRHITIDVSIPVQDMSLICSLRQEVIGRSLQPAVCDLRWSYVPGPSCL